MSTDKVIMSQSNRQSSTADKSVDFDEEEDEDTATIRVTRESFWAFVPHVTEWVATIVAGEANTARNALVGLPKWSAAYATETFSFYRDNPKILANEVRHVAVLGSSTTHNLWNILLSSMADIELFSLSLISRRSIYRFFPA